jgi:hypothetical protein
MKRDILAQKNNLSTLVKSEYEKWIKDKVLPESNSKKFILNYRQFLYPLFAKTKDFIGMVNNGCRPSDVIKKAVILYKDFSPIYIIEELELELREFVVYKYWRAYTDYISRTKQKN